MGLFRFTPLPQERLDQLTLTGESLSLSLSLKKVRAVRIAIPASPSKIGVSPKLLTIGPGTSGAATATGTGGGASATGRTHPPAGACAVAAALAAVTVTDEPHKAAAEACDPNMLSATIGLIVRAGADAATAEASAGLAQIETATPNEVKFLQIPPSIN